MALLERVATLVRANLKRFDRQGGRSREADQTSDPRHAESVAASQNASGNLDCRSAPAAQEEAGKRRRLRGVGSQGGAGGGEETGRPGARGIGAIDVGEKRRIELRRAGGRSDGAGGEPENGPAQTGAEAHRSSEQERRSDRAAQAGASAEHARATRKSPSATAPKRRPSTG